MSEYLAIKNWRKYQSLSRSGKWIKDYTKQDDEPELAKLTMFQRAVYQEIRRIRGRRGKNVENDTDFILCAMSAPLKDRPRIPRAIRELIACGLLVVTNQQDDIVNSSEKENEKENEKKKELKPSARKLRGVRSKPAQVSQALAETKHSRIQGMIFSAYSQENGVEPPWDGGEGKQLQALLKSTPGWPDELYSQCLGNLYASTGFAKGTRPREWLTHLPRYLKGPLNEFNREKGTGNGQANKAQQRERERDRKWAAIAGGGTPIGLPESGGIGLRPGLESGENRPVVESAHDATKLLAPRNH